MDLSFIGSRITQLLVIKGASEYEMSTDLGHSKSYIQHITSGRSLPSIAGLLQICEYFDITPKEFFDAGITDPIHLHELYEKTKGFDADTIKRILAIVNMIKE